MSYAKTTDTRTRAVYAAAAAEYGIPESVLLGVSYLESRWDTNAATPSTSGGFGPMHLTDAAYLNSIPEIEPDHGEDRRGDDSSEAVIVRHEHDLSGPPAQALQTIDAAQELTGESKNALRTDVVANIRGGAALLAKYQEEIGGPTGTATDPAAWYGAVARYSGSDTRDAAAAFAEEVYATIREGADRVTDDGHRVVLPPRPGLSPDRGWLDRLPLRRLERPDGLECPVDIACEWLPASYQLLGNGTNPGNYGQYDKGDRPAQQRIEYIVIHDAEAYYASTTRLAQLCHEPARIRELPVTVQPRRSRHPGTVPVAGLLIGHLAPGAVP